MMMKNVFVILVILIGMCVLYSFFEKDSVVEANNSEVETVYEHYENQKPEEKEPTQEEINEKIKKEAVKADFVRLNGHESEPKNKYLRVFIEGEISNVRYEYTDIDPFPHFLISQKEKDGYGLYHITNILNIKNLKDGDKVKVYGVVEGKTKDYSIKVSAPVIEKINVH
jgi:hypothetical protein